MDAVKQELFAVEVPHPARAGEQHPEDIVVVVQVAQRRERAHPGRGLAGEKQVGGGDHEIALEKGGVQVATGEVEGPVLPVPEIPAEFRVVERPAVVVDGRDVGEQTLGAALPLGREQPLEPVRGVDVVRVEDGHELAGGQRQPPVDGVVGVLVVLVVIAEPRIPHRLDDGAGSVGGAVVDHDQLQVGVRLGEYAVHRGLDEPLVVVGGDDDGNLGTHDSSRDGTARRAEAGATGRPVPADRWPTLQQGTARDKT